MPLNKDKLDKESLRAHHLLHRSCRGKAHGNGIAKQSNRCATISFPTRLPKDRDSSGIAGKSSNRRIVRNGTSSLECSDSDSMHSSETVQNAFVSISINNRFSPSNLSICGAARSLNELNTKKKPGRSVHVSSCLPKSGGKSVRKKEKKESWADTLRVGLIDDRIKRMEEGWDDSSVIRTSNERKWRRITAEIEQKLPSGESSELKLDGLRGSSLKGWNDGSQKRNRKDAASEKDTKPIEWEEIVEIALAKEIGCANRKRKCESSSEDVVDECVDRQAEDEPMNTVEQYMENLEVLLENRLPPESVEVTRLKLKQGKYTCRGESGIGSA
ncbi:hypothetical protein WH47_04422 [Habropoda laboriosa]|uniref:Uncharacterized protein n=1 Tax=Habropoda laboriosa TaxID=597456 RepID=A0A0L7QRN0_9HYME|nr:hypothetical protein WH47_04422 [Habropoda laboriosa]